MRTIDKIINITVRGSHLTKDDRNAGVQGEANVTYLRIDFDEGWDGYAKTVTFWDALLANPINRVLTVDQLENILESTRIYLVAIPGEAMTESGRLTFVIDGYIDGKRKRSIADTLMVKEAPSALTYENDPTPTQAEQLQLQIDTIMDTIEQANSAAADAQSSAEYARNQADSAESSAQYAQEWGNTAVEAKTAAEAAQETAETAQSAAAASAAAAAASQQAAQASETAAAQSAAAAKASEEAAKSSETNAKESETAAKASEENAAASATSAGNSAAAAAGSQSAAANSASSAGNSAASAATDAARAESAANRAEEAAGGDFVTPAGMAQYAVPLDGSKPMTGDMTIQKPTASMILKGSEAFRTLLMKNANESNDFGTILRDINGEEAVEIVLTAVTKALNLRYGGVDYTLYGAHNLDPLEAEHNTDATAHADMRAEYARALPGGEIDQRLNNRIVKSGDSMEGILTFDTPSLFSAWAKKRTIGETNYIVRCGTGNTPKANLSFRLATVAGDGTETVISQFDMDEDGLVWIKGNSRKTIAHSGNLGVLTASL